MDTAQLETMHRIQTGPDDKLANVLENVKNVREQYENRMIEHTIWESNGHNSIGLSLKFSAYRSNR